MRRPSKPSLNDPLFPEQQALFDKVGVFDAWAVTRGDPNVLLGVIDIGFDFLHPDLKSNLIPGFYASDACHMGSFESIAHGTVVASIIAAKENNSIGMVGLVPHCRVLAASHGMLENVFGRLQKKFRQDHPEAGPREFSKAMRIASTGST